MFNQNRETERKKWHLIALYLGEIVGGKIIEVFVLYCTGACSRFRYMYISRENAFACLTFVPLFVDTYVNDIPRDVVKNPVQVLIFDTAYSRVTIQQLATRSSSTKRRQGNRRCTFGKSLLKFLVRLSPYGKSSCLAKPQA